MSKITNEKNYVQKGDSLREQSREVPEFPGYTTSFDWRTARSILCTSANQEEFFRTVHSTANGSKTTRTMSRRDYPTLF
ncbi:MAG: hypothetical protein DA446_06410 [Bacteroidetes bacterium]|nr:MAG: hypothetical protein DA446_06410 [Bacteroidota bacterium]